MHVSQPNVVEITNKFKIPFLLLDPYIYIRVVCIIFSTYMRSEIQWRRSTLKKWTIHYAAAWWLNNKIVIYFTSLFNSLSLQSCISELKPELLKMCYTSPIPNRIIKVNTETVVPTNRNSVLMTYKPVLRGIKFCLCTKK